MGEDEHHHCFIERNWDLRIALVRPIRRLAGRRAYPEPAFGELHPFSVRGTCALTSQIAYFPDFRVRDVSVLAVVNTNSQSRL